MKWTDTQSKKTPPAPGEASYRTEEVGVQNNHDESPKKCSTRHGIEASTDKRRQHYQPTEMIIKHAQ